MKLLIEIPDTVKTHCDDGGILQTIDIIKLKDAVAHGTPLPKGHGRIVDIGLYEGKVIASRKYCGVNKLIEVAELDTLIEADKAESEH